MKYYGGCHCGRIKFEVDAPEQISAMRCNCSICSKSGYLHLLVESDSFRLLEGEEHLTEYTFNTGVAKHRFCKVCGIKSFYTPRSRPDGISVNVNCLETPYELAEIKEFDGRNWEKNVHQIR